MRSLFALALVASSLSAPAFAADAPAKAKLLDRGITRVELIDVLKTHGMAVTDATTSEEDPWLSAKTPKGTEFYVNMYDCEGTGAEARPGLFEQGRQDVHVRLFGEHQGRRHDCEPEAARRQLAARAGRRADASEGLKGPPARFAGEVPPFEALCGLG